jgi:hypothetical protein
MCASVVVDKLCIVSIAVGPGEADPPLVVDADAVLTPPITAKLLKPVARRRAQILKRLGSVQDEELPQHRTAKISRKPPNGFPVEEPFGVAIGEAPDHTET